MVKCCAPKCFNASYNKTPEITFHRFPKDEHLRNLWIKYINRNNWQPNASSALCSTHFEASLLCERNHRTMLVPGAIPTIFIEEIIEEHKEKVPLFSKYTIQKRSGTEVFALHNEQLIKSEPAATNRKTDQAACFLLMGTPVIHTATSTYPASSIATSNHLNKTTDERQTKLLKMIKHKNKKIKCLQEQKRRIKKKLQQFSEIISDLKKKLNEQVSVLSNVPVNNKDFIVR